MIRGVIFDIGQTLVEYRKPLNWSALYQPALERAAAACGHGAVPEAAYAAARAVLGRYNTRTNPRDREIPSEVIFRELLAALDWPMEDLDPAREAFYGFFRREAAPFPEAEEALRTLVRRGLLLGTLSDAAYGMDDRFILEDITPLLPYIRYPHTSHTSGFRKPRREGLLLLAREMGLSPGELLFVGDEEKDMQCARNAGVRGILADRNRTGADYGQSGVIHVLTDLTNLTELEDPEDPANPADRTDLSDSPAAAD